MARDLTLEGTLLPFTLLNRRLLLHQLLARLRARCLVSPQALRESLLLYSQSAQAIIDLLQLEQTLKLITHRLHSYILIHALPQQWDESYWACTVGPHTKCIVWAHLVSNQGPTGYEPVALPTELWARHTDLHHSTQNGAERQGSVAVSCLPSGVIHETPQHLTAAGMAQFAQRLRLDLAHPLARHVEVVTNLF